MLILRNKLIPLSAPDKLWQQYEMISVQSLGNQSTITVYAQKLEWFQLSCKNKDVEEIISNYTLKYKFVYGLPSNLKIQVRMQIKYDMSFEDIVPRQ